MIALPPTICREALSALKDPTETHVVRVVAHQANNPTVFRFRCRSREYLFEHDPLSGKHILDIPVSVWMHGADERGAWAGNATVADDFRGASSPYTLEVIRIADEAPPAVRNYLAELRRLLSGLGAPESVRAAFALIAADAPDGVFSAHVDEALAEFEATVNAEIAETPAQRNARRMREKRAAAKAAKLQPA